MLRPLLEKKLKLKKEKAKTNPYTPVICLEFICDDWIQPITDKKKEFFDSVCLEVIAGLSRQRAFFFRVFCVGISRKYLFDSQVP
jgi:hypothetical protein